MSRCDLTSYPDHVGSFGVCVFVFQIRSDKENYTKIIYSLTGPGFDQPPYGIFRINPETGFVRITAILDREEIPTYHVRTPTVCLQNFESHPHCT